MKAMADVNAAPLLEKLKPIQKTPSYSCR